MSVLKHGFVNIYRAGWFHRAGKPGNLDRHTGDIYDTYEKALASIDPPSHYVATVGISWVDTEDVQPNPDDSVPVPIRESRKAALRAADELVPGNASIVRGYENGGSFD